MGKVQIDEAFITSYLYPHVGTLDVTDNVTIVDVLEALMRSMSIYHNHDFTVMQVVLEIYQMWERFRSFQVFVTTPSIQYCEKTNTVRVSPEYFFRVRPEIESARWKSFREGELRDLAAKRHIFAEGGFADWNLNWLVNYAS